jgi:telomere length regulation protein
MADFLTAVKTVRSQSREDNEASLIPVSVSRVERQDGQPSGEKEKSTSNGGEPTEKPSKLAGNPEEALQILRSQPDTEILLSTLSRLSTNSLGKAFHLSVPGPSQAQIVNALVTLIIPTFWTALAAKDNAPLIACLANITGINAIIARLKSLVGDGSNRGNDNAQQLQDLIAIIERICEHDDVVPRLWAGIQDSSATATKKQLTWKEIVNLLGSGKIISVLAQAEDNIAQAKASVRQKQSWLANGVDYAAWLGRNIACLHAHNGRDGIADGAKNDAAQLLSRALSLGYTTALLKALFINLLRARAASSNINDHISSLTSNLPAGTRRRLQEQILRWLSDSAPPSDGGVDQASADQGKAVCPIAGLLSSLAATDGHLSTISGLLGDPSFNASISASVQRACIALINNANTDELQTLLDKTMSTFGDRLFIDNAPIIQQEALAQTLLLTAGYLHRNTPMAVLVTARSSTHMQGVSNRLDTSSQRARWLGMVVATAISSLVDPEGSRMNFDVDEVRTDEAKWYFGLVEIQDNVGTLKDFDAFLREQENGGKPRRALAQRTKSDQPRMLNGKPVFGLVPPPPPDKAAQTEVIGDKVTELLDDDDDEKDDDELKPYAKPDSDPEDSDEDATLVNRNKPRAPVYIRDLMRMLREDKDADKFQLAIQSAARLIRRKANFGGEVKDHAEELLRILCNLQDPFDTENFDELRLRAMIATLLSDAETLAPWLSRQAFAGDFSLAQRCIILSALGLAGRELAGYKNEDELNPLIGGTDFPTKRLPPRLHAIYAPAENAVKRLENAFQHQEHQLIKPMALEAADKTTAHLNAVKVRTFSSRMAVEQQRTKRKPAQNQLAKIFGPAFFFPLVNRYQQELAAYGSSTVYASSSFLLVTFVKTLAILLHASGPATLNLPEITTGFWELLLSLRVQAANDIAVLESVLFGLLTVLEMNSDNKRRVAEECVKLLAETQHWIEVVFERLGGGEMVVQGNEEEARVRTLAAGVLVKSKEVVEAYQREVFGRIVG